MYATIRSIRDEIRMPSTAVELRTLHVLACLRARTDSRTSCERLLMATAALVGSSVRGTALCSTGAFDSFVLGLVDGNEFFLFFASAFPCSYSDPVVFMQTTWGICSRLTSLTSTCTLFLTLVSSRACYATSSVRVVSALLIPVSRIAFTLPDLYEAVPLWPGNDGGAARVQHESPANRPRRARVGQLEGAVPCVDCRLALSELGLSVQCDLLLRAPAQYPDAPLRRRGETR